ncbi:choice-of-anchor Q domain-containing protein [Dokdonella sp.]|uniref:choice-of-anchor Q domain-containing protein n=1 Tax=Dokdonella sp. TaxID=2291710 RepID=UPI002F4196F8
MNRFEISRAPGTPCPRVSGRASGGIAWLRARQIALGVATALCHGAFAGAAPPAGHPAWLTVTNCDDHGPGSLRDTLAVAAADDWIDLSQLTCSTITLTTGALSSAQANVTLSGAGVTISGAGNSSVIRHMGGGTLELDGVIIEHGRHATDDYFTVGGCIYTRGDLLSFGMTVRNCVAESISPLPANVLGGGIYVVGDATLYGAVIEDNAVVAGTESDFTVGGGLYVNGFLVLSGSSVSANSTVGRQNNASVNFGGGLVADAAYIRNSTISDNYAHMGGGAVLGFIDGPFVESEIVQSTISNNAAHTGAGGLVSTDSLLKIWNSTIAFNTAEAEEFGPSCGGVFAFGGEEYVSLRSSIIANNTIAGVDADLCETDWTAQVVGFGNLVVASNKPLPPDTLQADPLLAPLSGNGGTTPTHALLPGSPAIDAGNNTQYLHYDQRGAPRVVGGTADIGAFELQPDAIFFDAFEEAPAHLIARRR